MHGGVKEQVKEVKHSRYFRISITQRCNMSCYYCHHEGDIKTYKPENELSPDDIVFACRAALMSGFRKFKLTGGEPTLRDDIREIISGLSKLNLPDFSIITNASKLEELAYDLWDAGLRRLNISLNTLNYSRFMKTQRANTQVSPSKILRGLDSAVKAGFKDIKINFVFRDNECISDLNDLIEYCTDKPYIIVLLPVISTERYYTLESLYELVKSYGIITEKIITDNEGVRKRLAELKNGAKVLLRIDELKEFTPFYFCNDCNMKSQCREGIFPLRMTYDGIFAPCMASDKHRINVREAILSRNYEKMKESFDILNSYYIK